MVQRIHKWCSVVSNSFAEHQTLYLNIKFLSITRNISMLWRIVVLACWFRRDRLHVTPPKMQTANGTVICWGAWRHRIWRLSKPSHVVRGLLRLAVKQSQFSEFLLFFSRRYCIHSLSFMKALIKIATRLDSTTVCRPPGLAHFARVGEPECL